MALISAGILIFRRKNKVTEVFLVHPGGPFFKSKDNGSWTIPKGLPGDGENLLEAAIRECEEETGIKPEGQFIYLDTIKQKGGKIVHAWAVEYSIDENYQLKSNQFMLEWPPKSGMMKNFPEVDKAQYFSLEEARKKIIAEQIPLLERLVNKLQF